MIPGIMLAFDTLEQKLTAAFRSGDTCPICYRTLEYDTCSITTCGHVHCRECIFRSRELARRCPSCRSEGLAFIHQFACCEEIPKELKLDASFVRLDEPEDGGNGYAVEDEESNEEGFDCPYGCDDYGPCLALHYGNSHEPVSQYCRIVSATDAQSWNGRMLEKEDISGCDKDDEMLESVEEEWYSEPNLYGHGKPGMVRMIVPDQVWRDLQTQYPNGVPKVEFRRLVEDGLLVKYA